MNELKVFNSPEFGEVRTVEVNGKPYFVASDVARALGYKRPNDAVSAHCKGTLKRRIGVQTGVKADGSPSMQEIEMLVITEGDIYRLVIRSQLPTAEKFENWIFDEVLPTIRKHGAYMTDYTIEKALTSPDFLIQLATKLKDEQEKNRALQADNDRMKPKEIFADAVSASDSSMLVRDLAKIIKQNGVALGEKRFYKWLRENGYICKTDTSPTQKAMELGLFEVIVRTVERGNGLPIETKTTKVTGKGQQYFINKFLNRPA